MRKLIPAAAALLIAVQLRPLRTFGEEPPEISAKAAAGSSDAVSASSSAREIHRFRERIRFIKPTHPNLFRAAPGRARGRVFLPGCIHSFFCIVLHFCYMVKSFFEIVTRHDRLWREA